MIIYICTLLCYHKFNNVTLNYEFIFVIDVTTSTAKAVPISTSSTTISTPRVQESTPHVRESTASVRGSTAPLKESTAPESTAVTANISMQLVPTENKASEAAGRTDTREIIDSVGGFFLCYSSFLLTGIYSLISPQHLLCSVIYQLM